MDTKYSEEDSLIKKVADHISAMLAYWDKDLVCRFANAAYLQWFGKKQEDMIGKITLKDLLGPLYELNLPYITAALNGEVQTFEREIPIPSGEGTRHSLANYYPDIVDGEVKGFIVHVADVSTLKELEQQLKHSNEIIKHQNQGLLNFSNIVSHNLSSYAHNFETILNLYGESESKTEKKQFLDWLRKISSNFSTTVSHLNEIVKMQNEDKLCFEKINLHDYIEQTLQVLHLQAKNSNATILNNIDKDATIISNPAYMESILLNLLSNAIKYRYPQRAPIIIISSEIKNNKTYLHIQDNGLGINLEKHGKDLFGMYKTFHGNADAQGIGLFITKYQAEAIGADIEVQSKENEGSTFTLVVRNKS